MADQVNLDKTNPEKDFNDNLKKILASSEPETQQADEGEPKPQGMQAVEITEQPEGEGNVEAPAGEQESAEAGEADASKPLPPAEAAIVALKQTLKKTQDENKLLKSALDERNKAADANKLAELISMYKKQGYDEDTAKHLANQEIEIIGLKRRADVADFREDNAELLEKYPQARKQIATIIEVIQKTGWTAEQVCRGMYGDSTSPIVEKNKAAVSGNLGTAAPQKPIGEATRTATPQAEKVPLSPTDQRTKANLEEQFKTKLTNERYFELKEKYNL